MFTSADESDVTITILYHHVIDHTSLIQKTTNYHCYEQIYLILDVDCVETNANTTHKLITLIR